MKENKKRIIVYSIIMFVFLILFFLGRSAYNKGYGTYGSMKQKLGPYAVEFNILDEVKRLTDIRAEVEKDKLVVTYITAENKKEKYKFEYKNENGIEYITNKDEYGNNTWNFVAYQMANAVYHINGGKGSIFNSYDPKLFATTTINDGLIIDTNTKTVSINLKTNVVNNVMGKLPSLKDDLYAKDTDLTTLASELKTNGFFRFEKQDIKIYVKTVGNTYEIYSSVTDDNVSRVYKSLASVVKILKPDVYQKLNLAENTNAFESGNSYFQSNMNVTFSEANIFGINDNIIQVILFK